MQQGDQITFVTNEPPRNLLTIGQRIAWARDQRRLTQSGLAKAAGVSQGTIGNSESGARDKPRELLKIAEALRVSPRWLERGEGPWEAGKAAPAAPAIAPVPAPDLLSSLYVVTSAMEQSDEAVRASVTPLFGFIGKVGFPSGNIATRIFTIINDGAPAANPQQPGKLSVSQIGLSFETPKGLRTDGHGSSVQKKSNEK